MPNISEDQIDQLNRNLTQLSGTMGAMAGRYAATEKGHKEAVNTLAGDVKSRKGFMERAGEVDRKLKESAQSLRFATENAEQFGQTMRDAARKIPGGFLLAELVHYTTETVKTYKQLSNIGQTFGGSMLQMSMAAGAAGLPLNEFANAVTSNSKVVATLGQGFFAINKDVRRAAEGMGLYGMSLEQLNNFSGSYLEQQRLTGALTRAGQARQVKAINELAQSVSGVAKITGVARDEIMRIAEGAMRDSSVVAAMAGNTARGMHAYNDEINKAVTLLSAQAGPAGEFLSRGLSQTFAMGGAQFTEQANAFLEAGFGEGALALQQAADKLARGMDGEQVQMELVNQLKAAADNPATREALLNQARAGNAQAREILAVTQNLKAYSRAEMEAAKAEQKRKDMLTGFATAFESIFSSLKGSLVEGFLKPFGESLNGTNFERTLENLKETFKPLEQTFHDMGKVWGENLKELLTGDNLKNFVTGLNESTKTFLQLTKLVFSKENMNTAMVIMKLIADVGLIMSTVTMGIVVPTLKAVVWGLNKLKGGIEGLFEFLKFPGGKTAAGLITGGLVIAGGIAIKMFFKNMMERFMGLRSPQVQITAGRVYVNGGVGGGGAGGDVGGEGGGRNRRGGDRSAARERLRRMRGSRGGMRGVLGRAANLADDVGTTASRTAGRFIPRGVGRVARGAGRFLGRAGLPLMLGMSAIDQFSMMGSLGDQLKNGEITKAEHDRQMAVGTGGNAGGLLGGLAAGAAAGAAGGALFGGVGAIPGAIIGGGIGAFAGSSAGRWVGGKWNDWRNRGANPNTPAGAAPNNPRVQQVDTQGQSDRMRDANRAAGQERTMEQLLAGINRMNQTMDESRQISTAQLERTIEGNRIARGTSGAIEDGRR